jgi:galactokinase
MLKERLIHKFTELFHSQPELFRSPGRINIIGEHTDYNDGFVFPAAINKEIFFAVAKNNVEKIRLYSYDLNEFFETDILKISKSTCHWANYLLGVIAQFHKENTQIQGIDCVFGGNIPLGAGLSSSAALENGFAFALNSIFNFSKSKINLVKIAQKAEHEYAGVQCGIMDQFASMYGLENMAIKLDCRTLEYEYAPLNLGAYTFLLCNTKVSHSLASSEYNIRRKQCEEAVSILKKFDNKIEALRDVNSLFLEVYKESLSALIYKRCKFVVSENERVYNAFKALENNDLYKLGQLMYQSHEGLKNDYEVSCSELDFLVEESYKNSNVLGARMMGGGFGGCTLNLLKISEVDNFSKNILNSYKNKFGIEPEIYPVQIANGTSWCK